jgi:hypothetical protein
LDKYSSNLLLETSLESREYGRRDLSCWPCGTLYLQTLALTSPTSGGRSVGILCCLFFIAGDVYQMSDSCSFQLYWSIIKLTFHNAINRHFSTFINSCVDLLKFGMGDLHWFVLLILFLSNFRECHW